jgi:hypothetical protein
VVDAEALVGGVHHRLGREQGQLEVGEPNRPFYRCNGEGLLESGQRRFWSGQTSFLDGSRGSGHHPALQGPLGVVSPFLRLDAQKRPLRGFCGAEGPSVGPPPFRASWTPCSVMA